MRRLLPALAAAIFTLLSACATLGGRNAVRLEPGNTYLVQVRNSGDCTVDVAFGESRAFDLPPGGIMGSVGRYETQTFTIAPDRRGYIFVQPRRVLGQRCGGETYSPVRVTIRRATGVTGTQRP